MGNVEVTAEEKAYLDKLVSAAVNASQAMRRAEGAAKNLALKLLAEKLDHHRADIKRINAEDIENAEESGLESHLVDRLLLNDSRIDGMIASVLQISGMDDPVGDIISGRTLPNGLRLQKVRVPLGVLTVIYESRPNVTIDVGALGMKSSNAVILRGGKEAVRSNMILAEIFQKALNEVKLPAEAVQLLDKTDRHLVPYLLKQKQAIDLVVPRGGAGLISFVSENSLIPVVKHDKGTCHVYIHEKADYSKAEQILVNSKVQRPSVCNAAESVVIDEKFTEKKGLLQALLKEGVKLHADTKTREILEKEAPGLEISELTDEGYGCEYLDLAISVKIARDFEAAISHVAQYSSAHTEAIVTEDYTAAQTFQKVLDSAALFVNCSTRFHDGGEFGLGAEVGIATGKLHARGPMGLTDLTTTKYLVNGTGQIRS